MALELPEHLVKAAAEGAVGNPYAAAHAGATSALSLVAKWLAAQYPAVHKDFLAEFSQ